MYAKFSSAELLTVYTTTMANTGSIDIGLRQELDKRGGVDYFQRVATAYQQQPAAFQELLQQIRALTGKETDAAFVRKLVHTPLLTDADLDRLVTSTVAEQQHSLQDHSIDRDTLLATGIATIPAFAVAAACWYAWMYLFHSPTFLAIPLVFVAAFYIISGITKKSFKNPLVLIATITAGLPGLAAGHFLYLLTQH